MAVIKSRRSLMGVSVPHQKHTQGMQSVLYRDIDTLILPMQQHMGAACKPCVKKGKAVKTGQLIGCSDEFFSAQIHAPCSGIVDRIEEFQTVTGVRTQAVVIQNDKKDEIAPTVKKPVLHDREDFIMALRESGAVGLGGAGFPVHVKLAYKHPERITKLVVNAAECEPYITADHRACLEDTADILSGIRAVQQYLGISDVYFAIESNKPDALRHLDNATKDDPSLHVVRLKTLYPQGAEKSIIYAATGITVKAGMLPADCGVIVMNVSSIGFVGKFLRTGMPLVEKRITVDGDCVAKPQNLIVPIGTPLREVLRVCGGKMDCKKLLMGGPMMGTPVNSLDTPVIKNNNAILAFSENDILGAEMTSCIRCGRCTRYCPMRLMPTMLEKAYDKRDADALENLCVSLCINCGCCSYACPARRQLAQKNQLAKVFVRNQSKK